MPLPKCRHVGMVIKQTFKFKLLQSKTAGTATLNAKLRVNLNFRAVSCPDIKPLLNKLDFTIWTLSFKTGK